MAKNRQISYLPVHNIDPWSRNIIAVNFLQCLAPGDDKTDHARVLENGGQGADSMKLRFRDTL
jgi:hypothetical protein